MKLKLISPILFLLINASCTQNNDSSAILPKSTSTTILGKWKAVSTRTKVTGSYSLDQGLNFS